MKKIIFMTLVIFNFNAMAQVPGPIVSPINEKLVFMDFKTANYQIIYDLNLATATVLSIISFETFDEGYPLFDLVPHLELIEVNDQLVTTQIIQVPSSKTKMHRISIKLKQGLHKLKIRHQFKVNVHYEHDSVDSIFRYFDTKDRYLLERYLPTNLEFDNYKIKISAEIKGEKLAQHRLISNGMVTKVNENKFEVTYPDFYNSSSVFYHLFPIKNYKVHQQNYKSRDGRDLPVLLYANKEQSWVLPTFKWRVFGLMNITKGVLSHIEHSYGHFPHNKMVLLVNNHLKGGMEYVAAAETSHKALTHEVLHMYFGRSVFPWDGQVGWVDEAITSWHDLGFLLRWRFKILSFFTRTSARKFFSDLLGTDKIYTPNTVQRKTNKLAYSHGMIFLAYLDHLFKQEGKSLKGFLNLFFKAKKNSQLIQGEFQKEAESYYGKSLENEFQQFIYF